MHELALTRSLVSIVTDRVPGVRVVRVRLEIGKLSGVFADSVRFCFDVVTAGTQLDGAVLEIVEPPGQGRCSDCSAMIELTDLISLCHCGSARVDLISGTQLLVQEVEVVRCAEPADARPRFPPGGELRTA